MEPPTSLSIKETIADLGNSGKPLLNSRLTDLSNLDLEELRFLEQVWVEIELERRQQIIYRLVELAEDNFELNFDSIFWNCLKDQDAEVRCKAIEGLWESEETSLINPLINLLEQDSSEKIQAAAATALGRFAVLAEHKKLRACYVSKVSRALLAAIGDESRPIEVKRRALEAAAPLSLPQIKKAIMKAYQSRKTKLRTGAIYAMGKSYDSSWLPVLLKELASTDAEIRYEAAGACGELGEEEAVPSLIKLINDPDIDVQSAAIQALGKIGGTEARECLKQCLNDPSEVISQMAEQALQELKVLEDSLLSPFETVEGIDDFEQQD
jgi:HEAT repeat protein